MGTPFLGSKISLISKSEIRYEGILYTIDTQESTIALSKVRSYGTENRNTDKPIAPRDEVYEYIIFRASDIKDLIVDDPPASGLAPGFTDPAIIQAHSISGSGGFTSSSATVQSIAPTAPSSSAAAVGQRSVNIPVFGTSMNTTQTGVTSGPPSGPAFGSSGGSTPTPTQGPITRRSPVSDNLPSGQNSISGDKGPYGSREGNQQNRPQNRVSNRQSYQQPQYNQYRRPNQGPQGPHGPPGPLQQRQNQQMGYRGGRPGPPGPPGRPRGPMMSRAPPQPRPQYNRGMPNRSQKPESLKIDGDYDFEKANQEFQELENKLSKIKVDDKKDVPEEPEKVTDEVLKEEKVIEEKDDKKDDEENTFYDKTKSFFDKISCEALERSKGKVNRIDWRQERKMNAETFGVLMNNFRRGSGGYRGRGYGGYRQNRNFYNQRNYGGGGRGGSNLGGGDSRRNYNQPPRAHRVPDGESW